LAFDDLRVEVMSPYRTAAEVSRVVA
jgi:hypothetical protein